MLPTLGGAARQRLCDTKVTHDPASGCIRPLAVLGSNRLKYHVKYCKIPWAWWADPRSYGDQVRLIRVNGSLHTMRPNLPIFPWTSLQMGGTCVSWAVCLRCPSWCSPAAHGDARSQFVVACAPPAADLAGPIQSSQPGTSHISHQDFWHYYHRYWHHWHHQMHKICGPIGIYNDRYVSIRISHIICHRIATMTFCNHIFL